MSLCLVICDEEEKFATLLADYLGQTYRDQMQVMAFDNVECLRSFVKTADIDLCVISDSMCDFELEKKLLISVEKLVYLTSEKRKNGIYRYQSVDQLTKSIFTYCLDMELPLPFLGLSSQDNSCKLITFFAPSNLLCQRMSALAYCYWLAKDNRVLYLNLGCFTGFSAFFRQEYQQDILDLLFFLNEDPDRFLLRLQGIIQSEEGFDYVPPSYSYSDLEEVEKEIWNRLIQKIMQEGNYDYLVLDLASHVRGFVSILERSQDIFICLSNSDFAAAEKEEIHRYFSYIKRNDLAERISYIYEPKEVHYPSHVELFLRSSFSQYIKDQVKNYHE